MKKPKQLNKTKNDSNNQQKETMNNMLLHHVLQTELKIHWHCHQEQESSTSNG